MQHYQTTIIDRFWAPGSKERKEFEGLYTTNRKTAYFKEPTKEDYKIADFHTKFGASAAAKRFGLKNHQVHASCYRVYTEHWKKTKGE